MVKRHLPRWFLPALLSLTFGLLLIGRFALAQEGEPDPPMPAASPIHPTFPLLDAAGVSVVDSGSPISTMTTCGSCHDTTFIAQHSFHADAGLSSITTAGDVPGGRSWDTSPGLFGKWNPLTYRYLSPQGDEPVDLTTAEWVQQFGNRHAGGGPAVVDRSGRSLLGTPGDPDSVEASYIDPETGEALPWDWAESGVAEMNCFLCHMPGANNDARVAALEAGQFGEAATVTLLGTGIVESDGAGWAYNPEAFDAAGHLRQPFVTVQDPATANCGSCHGVTHTDIDTPLTLDLLTAGDYTTLTTGQIMSPQRIDESGLNLANKSELGRSWDVHMERVLACADCHYSLNNPIYYQESPEDRPAHLTFDPRRIDFSEYLYRPLHQFAKGQSAQGTLAPGLDNTLRRCESCHSIEATHNWLPYKERHTAAMSCETCHVPELYAPALESVDWTVLTAAGEPVQRFRGLEGDSLDPANLITGFQPVILPRDNGDGTTTLAPFNLISAWYWVYGDPVRPVPLRDLQAVYLDGDSYSAEVLAAFDADGDGLLTSTELHISTDAQEALIAGRLAARGLANARIEAEVQPYGINHNVAQGDWVTRECTDCHGEDSRLAAPMALSDRTPGGVTPILAEGGPVSWPGTLEVDDTGALRFEPDTSEAGLYVLGHNSVSWVDWLGVAMVLGVLIGIVIHGGLRFIAARRQAAHAPTEMERVYMYDVYERLWHWLQTAAILLLLFTGLIIHKPDMFGMFSFSYVVQVHNILALLLVINAGLSLFYHLASGEIRQFIPHPRGFFDQAFEQATYYLRGIFKGDPHPTTKSRDRKLNPLQQITYVMVLNILLPLQIITGALMWGAQRWPEAAASLGGLPGLGPFHTLIAWSFTAFIILHVYLTTTGPSPLAGMEAMVLGWEDVEVDEASPDQSPEHIPAAGD